MDHVYNLSLFEAVELLRTEGMIIAQYDPSMQCEVWMRRNGNRFEVCYGEGCRWTQAVCLFVHSRFRLVTPRYMDLQEFADSIL